MIDMEAFKEQLLEFVEEQNKPFNVKFIVEQCIQPVDKIKVQEILYQLENEGKIIWLNHHYLPARVLMRRWFGKSASLIKKNYVQLPLELYYRILKILTERPELGYIDVEEFVRDAVRRFIQKRRFS